MIVQDLQLLTCDEVAEILRVSSETVRQLAASGELPGRKIGRAWRFPRTAIEAYCLGDLKPVQKDQITAALEPFLESTQQEVSNIDKVDVIDQTTDLSEVSPIDAESLLARCFGNLEFAESLLDELESTGIQRVEEIRQCVERKNVDGAADAAHALKGAAGILCADTVQDLAAEIEKAGRSSSIETVEAELDELVAEMQQCLNYLPQLRQELKHLKEGA